MTDTPSLSELVARLRVRAAGWENHEVIGEQALLNEAADTIEALITAKDAWKESWGKQAQETIRLSRLSGNGGGAVECNLPFERMPTCACDPGHGDPPTKAQKLACKIGGGPCSGSGGGEGAATPSASLEGWRFDADASGIVYVHAPSGRACALGHFPQGHRNASEILRELITALLQAEQSEAAPPPNLEPQCGVGEITDEMVEAGVGAWINFETADPEAGVHGYMRAALQAASAAAPKPIDDGAVERVSVPRSTLEWIKKKTADKRNPAVAFVCDKLLKGEEFSPLRDDAALQAYQTKT